MNTFDSVFSKVCRLSLSLFSWITLTFFFLCMFSTTMNAFNNVFFETYRLSLCLSFCGLIIYLFIFSFKTFAFVFCLHVQVLFLVLLQGKGRSFFLRWSNRLLEQDKKEGKRIFFALHKKGVAREGDNIFHVIKF